MDLRKQTVETLWFVKICPLPPSVGYTSKLRKPEVSTKVRKPTEGEVGLMKKGAVLIALMEPYKDRALIDAIAAQGVTAFALEMVPRITRAQSMDVLSSQSNLAGYRAVLDAADEEPCTSDTPGALQWNNAENQKVLEVCDGAGQYRAVVVAEAGSGNVGVGTDAPGAKLHVEPAGTGTIAKFSRGGGAQWLTISTENAHVGTAIEASGAGGVHKSFDLLQHSDGDIRAILQTAGANMMRRKRPRLEAGQRIPAPGLKVGLAAARVGPRIVKLIRDTGAELNVTGGPDVDLAFNKEEMPHPITLETANGLAVMCW